MSSILQRQPISYKPYSNNCSFLGHNMFRMTDNEVYMISNNNLDKAFAIVRNTSQESPKVDDIEVDEDIENHNNSIIQSLHVTRELFKDVFDIKQFKVNSQNKFMNKYKEFKKHLQNVKRKERLQKIINLSYRKAYGIFPEKSIRPSPSTQNNQHLNQSNLNNNNQTTTKLTQALPMHNPMNNNNNKTIQNFSNQNNNSKEEIIISETKIE